MSAYYNELDPFAAAWLRELIRVGEIAGGEVDERSIVDVRPDDLRGFTQCHFFAGIGGWSYALRLAGWPDDRPVWTGSCPCQPFSTAGKRAGAADARDLWPHFFRLIEACKPPVVFGEQVASSEVVGSQQEAAFLVAVQTGNYARANRLAKQLVRSKGFHFHPRWLTRIRADMARADYALWTQVLGAHSVGAFHIRQRLYWVADRDRARRGQQWRSGLLHDERPAQRHDPDGRGADGRLGDRLSAGLERHERYGDDRNEPGRLGADQARPVATASGAGFWDACDWLPCSDGKARPVEPGTFPLAYGVSGRVGRLRGYGNAIVPPLAAEFIKAYRAVLGEDLHSL